MRTSECATRETAASRKRADAAVIPKTSSKSSRRRAERAGQTENLGPSSLSFSGWEAGCVSRWPWPSRLCAHWPSRSLWERRKRPGLRAAKRRGTFSRAGSLSRTRRLRRRLEGLAPGGTSKAAGARRAKRPRTATSRKSAWMERAPAPCFTEVATLALQRFCRTTRATGASCR